MTLFKTDNIELSIRKMVDRNRKCLIFDHVYAFRRIPAQLNLVADIPCRVIKLWEDAKSKSVKDWQDNGGLAICKLVNHESKIPFIDGSLFVEPPIIIDDLQFVSNHVERELIVFRPPDWSMHQEYIDHKYPTKERREQIIRILNLRLNPDLLNKHEKFALEAKNLNEKVDVLFNENDMCKAAGFRYSQFRDYILSVKELRNYYVKLDPVTPMIAPNNPDLLEMYRILESQKDYGGGVRMLVDGKVKQVPGFRKALKTMIKEKNVLTHQPVHVLKDGWQNIDFGMHDAIIAEYRDRARRLREAVDSAPDYLEQLK